MSILDQQTASLCRTVARGASRTLVVDTGHAVMLCSVWRGHAVLVVVSGDPLAIADSMRCSELDRLPRGGEKVLSGRIGVSVAGCSGRTVECPPWLETALRAHKAMLGDGIHPGDVATIKDMGRDAECLVSSGMACVESAMMLSPGIGGAVAFSGSIVLPAAFIKGLGSGEGVSIPFGGNVAIGSSGRLVAVCRAWSPGDDAVVAEGLESLKPSVASWGMVSGAELQAALGCVARNSATVRMESRGGMLRMSGLGFGEILIPLEKPGAEGVCIVDAGDCLRALRGCPKGKVSLASSPDAFMAFGTGRWGMKAGVMQCEREMIVTPIRVASPARRERTMMLPLGI